MRRIQNSVHHPMSTNEIYLKELKARVEKYYSYGEADHAVRHKLKDQIKGFLDAGIVSGLVTVEQTRHVIDTEHQKAFGMSIEERRAHKKLGVIEDPVDWSEYEAPTYQRLNSE